MKKTYASRFFVFYAKQRINLIWPKGGEDVYKEFVMLGSVCAIAPSEKLSYTLWFVKIKNQEETSEETVIVGYGNKIIPSQNYFTGKYLEKDLRKKQIQLTKSAFIYKASIVYPFVKIILSN